MQEGQCHDPKRTCYPGLQLLDFQSKSGTSLFILHCSIDNDLREETKEGLETYKVSRRLGDVLACIFFSKSFNLSKCGLTKVGRNPGHLDPSGLDSIFCAPSVTSWQQHNCRDTMGTDAHKWNRIHNRTTLGISTQSIQGPIAPWISGWDRDRCLGAALPLAWLQRSQRQRYGLLNSLKGLSC